jgi:hypothetical protein
MGQWRAARNQLLACEGELTDGDELDRAEWTELAAEAKHAELGGT